MNQTENLQPADWQQGQGTFNIRKAVGTLLSYWPRFTFCVIISLLITYLYLRYTKPVYVVKAKILIQNDKTGSLSDAIVLDGLGIKSKGNSIENEVEIFKSRAIMEQVVRSLQLNVSYYTTGRVKTVEVFENKPFNFTFCPMYEDSLANGQGNYKITLTSTGYDLMQGTQKISGKVGDTINLLAGRVCINKVYGSNWVAGDQYLIVISTVQAATGGYMGAFNAMVVGKNVSMINLSLGTQIPDKGVTILNRVLETYLAANVKNKNRIADSTIAFIDDRLSLVGGELANVEKQIEYFKRANDLTDIKTQSTSLVANDNLYSEKINTQRLTLSLVESLEKYLQENINNRKVVPPSLIVPDQNLTGLVIRYNELELNRNRLLMSNTEDNPIVKNIDDQLNSMRIDMLSDLEAVKRNLLVTLGTLSNTASKINAEIQQVPTKERVYLEYSRQQTIKQELYVFLLKKREETAIAKSSTIADARIIDFARADSNPVSPKRPQIFMIALLLSIILPGASIYIESALNNRILKKEDISNNTQAPIIGEIGHSPEDKDVVIHEGSRTILAEQFRSLRTNLQFVISNKADNIIMLTSSMSGEGKSFIAINLANTLAISGKKVLLMELDLRKPKISSTLGIDSTLGFSNYIIGQVSIDKIIVPSGLDEKFSVMPCGPIPPNPVELIMLPQTEELFATLKKSFDFVIIDTAPIGLVTDAQLLAAYANTTLYVVRQGYTYRQQIVLANELYVNQKMPKFSIVVNDIKTVRGSSYGYGYGYGYGGYGYGYGGYTSNGYFDDKNKKGFIKRIFNFFDNKA